MKENFIQNEIWVLVFGAAFGRANVYKDDAPDQERKYFKNKIRSYVEEHLINFYKRKTISDDEHVAHIHALADYSDSFREILVGGKLRFGVAQKMLNLYLKYQWCLGNIETPPHFPVDRIIQKNAGVKPIINWTQLDCPNQYMEIVERVREHADKNNMSLSEYELGVYKRQ